MGGNRGVVSGRVLGRPVIGRRWSIIKSTLEMERILNENTQQHLRGNRKVRFFVSDGFRHGDS